ncbi:NlpE N-terminal domain-containing protein [Franzmannia pantelleriensis]|uniref:NlpE N-terminal domain-containing protein n=1 Tax=Franzmannia pantelleriensis TaxID=48727 RepID=A0A1G9SX79_9GAMM|nr:copper resistance protein NlpE N-terminal domain-containing protein [Halomonas pantelleriensis]SDM40039.1 NlpE N-terminal domain-containing protein [Halomonas pantelleriensis]
MRIRTLLAGSAVLAVMAGCAAGPTEGPAPDMAADGEAVYQGTLPCRNCAGIDIDVRMMGDEQSAIEDRTFALEASYREHPQDPPSENYTGNWEVLSGSADDPNATVYELTPENEGQIYYFLRVDDATLELIDPERRRFENNDMLQLQRQ